jgi:hypothetical protein
MAIDRLLSDGRPLNNTFLTTNSLNPGPAGIVTGCHVNDKGTEQPNQNIGAGLGLENFILQELEKWV